MKTLMKIPWALLQWIWYGFTWMEESIARSRASQCVRMMRRPKKAERFFRTLSPRSKELVHQYLLELINKGNPINHYWALRLVVENDMGLTVDPEFIVLGRLMKDDCPFNFEGLRRLFRNNIPTSVARAYVHSKEEATEVLQAGTSLPPRILRAYEATAH